MAKIIKILGWEQREDHCIVFVRTDTQDDAQVYVGGSVELFHDPKFDVTKAFVKRSADKPKEES